MPGTEVNEIDKSNIHIQMRDALADMIRDIQGPDKRPPSRELALAVTKLQEARMWIDEHMAQS